MLHKLVIKPAKKLFGFFSSLKTAIPLLVLTIAVTIAGSLLPTPDFFKSWWYLGLLGLNGVSLLSVTILHTPMILERKGRNALIGVMVTHLGILILIAGAIYGGTSGFRYQVKVIEEEMTIVPGLPFVIHLDKLLIEEYPEGTFTGSDPNNTLKKRQESHLSLFKNGKLWTRLLARPGAPARVEGMTLLPSLANHGWYFELAVTDPQSRTKVIPIKPWAPPLIRIGSRNVMAHSLVDGESKTAQIFTIENEQMSLVGLISNEQVLELDGYTIALGSYKRYTGLSIYNRPHAPVLIIGCLAMLFGLVWHFYFRHRDRAIRIKGKQQHV